ncbi:response regulator [Nocardiopsis terrae]
MIRVVVAEDQWAVRAGLVMILDSEPDISVVAEASDGAEAIAATLETRPDVLLMDIRMPRKDGITATRELVASEGLETDILILTTFEIDEYVFGALRAGAVGFLLKNIEASDLLEAVRTVARGEGIIAPSVIRRLISKFASVSEGPEESDIGRMFQGQSVKAGRSTPDPRTKTSLESLTPREVEVLKCLGQGLSNRDIARRLSIAEATTKTHVSRLLVKLDLRSRVQAAILAQENRLVD